MIASVCVCVCVYNRERKCACVCVLGYIDHLPIIFLFIVIPSLFVPEKLTELE